MCVCVCVDTHTHTGTQSMKTRRARAKKKTKRPRERTSAEPQEAANQSHQTEFAKKCVVAKNINITKTKSTHTHILTESEINVQSLQKRQNRNRQTQLAPTHHPLRVLEKARIAKKKCTIFSPSIPPSSSQEEQAAHQTRSSEMQSGMVADPGTRRKSSCALAASPVFRSSISFKWAPRLV